MKNKGGIWALTIVLLLISVYFLARTFKINSIRQDATAYASKGGKTDLRKKQQYLDSLWKEPVFLGSTVKELTEQELGLGLDLQGGMHVILEVSPLEVVKALAGNPRDPKFAAALTAAQTAQKSSNANFVDLFTTEFSKQFPGTKLSSFFVNSTNRGTLSLTSSDGVIKDYIQKEVDGAFDRSFRVIQSRIDQFGTTNPNIQKLPNSNRIQIELPGIDNVERVRKLLTGAAKLEFCEVYNLQEISSSVNSMGAILQQMDAAAKPAVATAAKADTSKGNLADKLAGAKTAGKDSAALNQPGAFSSLFQASQNGFMVKLKDTSKVNQILARADVRGLYPPNLSFVYDIKAEKNTKGDEVLEMIAIKDFGNAPLDGSVITDAGQGYTETGKVEVNMRMNGEGARRWKNITASNIGRRVAIILDGVSYSAPNINGEIPNGNSSISGNFTVEEAQDLASVLKAGKLPAPANIVEEAVVGSSLGSEAISAGWISAVVGLIIVLLFVLLYYAQAGIIADIALLVNSLLMLGVMAALGATLTLPGIAGLVLSLGMSVDVNVLIYERIKEELALGKDFKSAVNDGFKHALSSIIDSNVTTAITGIVLFFFGTGLILGFATTLLIGIATSLFSGILISRLFFEYLISKGTKVNFFTRWTEKLFKDSNFDFVSRRRLYYIISSTIIVLGIVSIFVKGFGLGVDFKGGRTYVARFEKDVNTDLVRSSLEKSLGAAPEVKTFGGSNQVKITTSYMVDNTSVDADKMAETKITEALSIAGNKGQIMSSGKIGPSIAYDTMTSAIKAILLSILLVSLYIFFRFKKLGFVYGALVALFHDVAIILGIFSILNGILPFSLDVDQAFVGAVLTIMGYSMNDTVVVFDRVREYLNESRGKKEAIATVINNALNSTLSRTAVTGFSTLLVLGVLLVFGGATIRGFVFAMFVGVIVGTYSSLFVATPIVVDTLQRDMESQDAANAAAATNAAAGLVAEVKKK
jgi:SecD/SecF fusion protein